MLLCSFLKTALKSVQLVNKKYGLPVQLVVVAAHALMVLQRPGLTQRSDPLSCEARCGLMDPDSKFGMARVT